MPATISSDRDRTDTFRVNDDGEDALGGDVVIYSQAPPSPPVALFAAVSAITIEPFIFPVLVRLYILYPATKHDDNRYKNYLAKAAAIE